MISSIVFSIVFYCLCLLFALLWGQPSSSARQKQMDLIVSLLCAQAGAAFLCHWSVLAFLDYGKAWLSWFWIVPGVSTVVCLAVLILSPSVPLPQSFVHGVSRSVQFLFGWIPKEEPAVETNLDLLLEAGSSPEIEEDQREVIENALDLGETTLDEMCTHRSEMICLSMKEDPAKWKQIIMANRHTFYPITNESDDDIIGILDTRDYFRMDGFGKKTILEKCVDKPLFAAENTTADELLRRMKSQRTYLAIVLDEYGGVVGLITLHDIIEELFGELSEEDGKRQADIVKLPRGVWRISGEADLKDVSKALGLPLELDDFETFSGYVLGSIGYIPDDGSQLEVTAGPLTVQIKRMEGHRIRQTLVRLSAGPAEETSVKTRTSHPEKAS